MNEQNLIPDNPEFDGTDGAHPAWWRGCDDGVFSTVRCINGILDDIQANREPKGTFISEKLNMLRDRLYNEFRRKH